MNTDPMAEIRASFFIECEELLESLQDALGDMENGADDSETVNVVFRAVHSIKGGAGAFGLDALVGFAHRFETVMDVLRAGRLSATPDAIKLFFNAADLLQDHVRAARDGDAPPLESEACLQALEALIDAPCGAEEEVNDFQPMGLGFDLDALDTAPLPDKASYLIRFRPLDGLYHSGNEPAYILRALAALGEAEIHCDWDDLPGLDAIVAEQSYLSWTIRLTGPATESEIHEVFDFVEDLCALEITPDLPVPDLPPAPVEDPDVAAPEPAPPPQIQTIAPASASSSGASHAEAKSPTVRVDLERIDRLVNLVGELVINQAMLAQSVNEAGLAPNSAVMTGLEAFMMLTRDIQDSVMMIRAQPVKPLFQRMARIVREAAASTGKEVRFRTEGETTEVDKTVIERLADPLTHMIRNAVDHGLETPPVRAAGGKPPEGSITLTAKHRSGRVIIEIRDDGAGIDRDRVRAIAVSKGLIAPDATLSDGEIDNLLFLPGFSTASEVSNLSGRGVGMDVVRSAIVALGGRISISSERGKGTCFSISLPLTLAVLDGMVISVARETLVIPLSSIHETATLTPDDIRMLHPGTHVVHMRGDFIRLLDLGAALGYRAPKPDYSGDIVLFTSKEDGTRSALVVDAILEQRQVVIKGLERSYGHIPGVAAATILGDGQIALILDPADLAANSPARSKSNDLYLAG